MSSLSPINVPDNICQKKISQSLIKTLWKTTQLYILLMFIREKCLSIINSNQRSAVSCIISENLIPPNIIGRRIQCIDIISREKIIVQHIFCFLRKNEYIGKRSCCDADIGTVCEKFKQSAYMSINCGWIVIIVRIDGSVVRFIINKKQW